MHEYRKVTREYMETRFNDPKNFMDGGKWKRFDIQELVGVWEKATGWEFDKEGDRRGELPNPVDEITGIIGEASRALDWLGIFREHSGKTITHHWIDMKDETPREATHELVDALWVDMRLLPYYLDLLSRVGTWDFDELDSAEGFDAQVYILALIQSDDDIDYSSGFVSSILEAINELVEPKN